MTLQCDTIDDSGICDICISNIDKCICPKCPKCHEIGNALCYAEHGLKMTQQQLETRDANVLDQEYTYRLEITNINNEIALLTNARTVFLDKLALLGCNPASTVH